MLSFPKLSPGERIMSFELEGGLQLAQEAFSPNQGKHPLSEFDLCSALQAALYKTFGEKWDRRLFDHEHQKLGYNTENFPRVLLPNGSIFYGDGNMAYPELALYECDSARRVVIAYEATVRLLAPFLSRMLSSAPVSFYGDNFDAMADNSHGGHENYFVEREVIPQLKEESIWHLFLTLRPLFAGTGCYVPTRLQQDLRNYSGPHLFRISQRSQFITKISATSSGHRPLFLECDEAFADRDLGYRLQVISGDTNVLRFAAFQKFLITSLVLQAMEEELLCDLAAELNYASSDALTDLKALDQMTGRWVVPSLGVSGVAILRKFHTVLTRTYASRAHWVTELGLKEFGRTLDLLDRLTGETDGDGRAVDDPHVRELLGQRVDWVNKQNKIDAFSRAEGRPLSFAHKAGLSLEYHLLNPHPDHELVPAEERGYLTRDFISEREINAAMSTPDSHSRVLFRHHAANATSDAGRVSMNYDYVCVHQPGTGREVVLPLADPERTYLEDIPDPATGISVKEAFHRALQSNPAVSAPVTL